MIRLFPGRLPNVSKSRTSLAMLAGIAVSVVVIFYGKSIQPPIYPVAPLIPLTDEEASALQMEVRNPTVPEHLPLTLARPYMLEWNTGEFVLDLPLEPATRQAIDARLQADPVDPLVPALVALAKRAKLLGKDPAVAPVLEQFIRDYPAQNAGPDCTGSPKDPFHSYVCTQRQAFHRSVMQRTLFQAWYDNEVQRHQFGALWKWAWLRSHQIKRAGLFVHNQLDSDAWWTSDAAFVDDLTTVSASGDTRTPVGILHHSASSPSAKAARPVDVLASGSPAPYVTLEQRLFPMETMSCGASRRTAQTQIAPFHAEDRNVIEMCNLELKRRADAESQLQQHYAKLLSLRDLALHNKNMLQFFAWRTQRNALYEVQQLFDAISTLEHHRLPTFTLIAFNDAAFSEMSQTMEHTSKALGTPPASTLYAFATYPKEPASTPAVSVLRSPSPPPGQDQWVLALGTPEEGHIHRKGNVLFVDETALQTLGLSIPTAGSPLWSRCVDLPTLEEPATWCTRYQWLALTTALDRPGVVDQIVRSSINVGAVSSLQYIPPGSLAFWGNHLKPGETPALSSALTASAPVTLYSFLSETPIDPLDEDWAYPSLLDEFQ